MTEPIKISEQGRALTCDEYDDNLDILRDRANHTGTQSCNTLNDLDTCLATSSTVNTINVSIGQNTTRINNLENTLSASGSIANDLNTLEATLTADINQNRASITVLETDLEALTIRVSGTESNLTSLTAVVANNNTATNTSIANINNTNNAQNTRLTNVENRATTLNSNILSEAATRQLADTDLQSQIDAEELSRINADILINSTIQAEEDDRIAADNTITTNLNTQVLNLNNSITAANNARIAGDSNLQAQLNSLSSSLSTAIPTATVLPYLGNFNTIPTGFLLCAGAAVSRTTYATLFSRISTRYGVGNGTTTFNLPDFKDKIMYGSSNGTLDNTPIQVGANTKAITVANMPNHDHTIIVEPHTHTVDIQHDHDLYIHPHTHGAGPIGAHGHSLNPYRRVAIGGGDEDQVGAELTDIPSDEVNTYPNTAINNAPGPVISPAQVQIFAPPYQGGDKTNALTTQGAARTTATGGAIFSPTVTKGDGVAFDVRQDSLRVNYIIKT